MTRFFSLALLVGWITLMGFLILNFPSWALSSRVPFPVHIRSPRVPVPINLWSMPSSFSTVQGSGLPLGLLPPARHNCHNSWMTGPPILTVVLVVAAPRLKPERSLPSGGGSWQVSSRLLISRCIRDPWVAPVQLWDSWCCCFGPTCPYSRAPGAMLSASSVYNVVNGLFFCFCGAIRENLHLSHIWPYLTILNPLMFIGSVKLSRSSCVNFRI